MGKSEKSTKSLRGNVGKVKVDLPTVLKIQKNSEKPTYLVAAVNYMKGESKELQMESHEDVETGDSEAV